MTKAKSRTKGNTLVEDAKIVETGLKTILNGSAKAENHMGEDTPEPEYLPSIEIVYDKTDRKQPYKVLFYNCETRSVFQKMIVFTFQKALMVFRRTLIMEGEKDGGK